MGKARQESNQAIDVDSAVTVAGLGQARSQQARPRRGQTQQNAPRRLVTVAKGPMAEPVSFS
jgi:hypothetical protein